MIGTKHTGQNNGMGHETEKGRELMKKPVLCWAVMYSEHSDNGAHLYVKPLEGEVTFGSDTHPPAFDGFAEIWDTTDDVVGVLPSANGTMAVYGWMPVQDPHTALMLGYEYPGATNPDWDAVIESSQNYEDKYPDIPSDE